MIHSSLNFFKVTLQVAYFSFLITAWKYIAKEVFVLKLSTSGEQQSIISRIGITNHTCLRME